MKQVLVLSPNKQAELLRKALLEKHYPKPVLVRLGAGDTSSYRGYPLQINGAEAVHNTIDRYRMKKILSNWMLPVARYSSHYEDWVFPFIIKGNYKNKDRASVFYVENKSELNAILGMVKNGYYCEPVFRSTSEYRLFCTQKEVFLSLKKIKEFPEDIITNCRNSSNVRMIKEGPIKFPKLWNSVQKSAISAVTRLGLDIASVDIGYTSENDHNYIIHKVNCNPALPTNVFNMYVDQIDKLIKAKL